MLTRPQVLLLAGMLLLATVLALTYIIRRAQQGQPLFTRHLRRLRFPQRTLRMLRRCLFLHADVPELAALHSLAQALTEALLTLRRDLQALPPLPGEHEPRLMSLARQIAAQDVLTATTLGRMLNEWDTDEITVAERLALPVCTAVASTERLHVALRTLLEDDHDRQRATRLAAQLTRSARPMALLTRQQLSLAGLAALLSQLRSQRQTVLLEIIEQWLSGHGTDAEDIADRHARRQTAIADDLHTAADQFAALRIINWESAVEESDPLHSLLLNDPSGLYPRMSQPSRQMLRTRAELLARVFRVGTGELITAALRLCEDAEHLTLERHVGYYLLEYEGISVLRVQLALRRGRISIFLLTHRFLVRRTLLWAFSIACALPFLNEGNPLFMLPTFLVAVGCIPRALMERFSHPEQLPALDIDAVSKELRTLVVLPATLSDASDALHMLRHLRTARCAFPAHGVDCLLLGDYTPAITQRSGADAAVISAAAQGTTALCDESGSCQFMYMQRARVWQPQQHTYAPRGSRAGAVETICRLIAQGESEDFLDHATFSPASLHRRYAFILVLDGLSLPMPGMLEAMLSTASHPMNTRYPTPEGFRGASAFSPDAISETPSSHEWNNGCGIRLIRPDAYLESLEGQLSSDAEDDHGFLTDALPGMRIVPQAKAHVEGVSGILRRASFECRRIFRLCRITRWLLPWVKTPAGIVRNPLPVRDRFTLRERLRTAILPLCRSILLLWALLERNAPLMFIALLLPEALALLCEGHRSLALQLQRCVLLPLRTSAAVYAAFRAILPIIRRQEVPSLREPENWQGLEIWSQCTTALICFLLCAVVPPLWLPAFLPAAVFAAFPLLHMWESRELAPAEVLPAEDEPSLRRIAEATWQYFIAACDASPVPLPIAWTQTEPAVTVPPQTSPESAGIYLTSVVCAKELGFIGAAEAGERIVAAFGVLKGLPLRHGLPCKSYLLPSLEVNDDAIDARDCGILLVALMTAAQALRVWLPELPPSLHDAPAALDAYAASLDISRLYDPSAGLMHIHLDRDGHGVGHALYFADEALLLSVASCARGIVPPAHFHRLSRTCAEAGGEALPLSKLGDISSYLLPGLFLPLDARMADRLVWLQQRHGIDGLWGRSPSSEHAFTPRLHYRRGAFGLREIASGEAVNRPVFAPYASALALPFTPGPALRVLHAMQQLGAFGPHGYYDAVDMTTGKAQIVHMQDTLHQGLILCAAAHVLADAPLRRYFSGLPIVEACLPLLHPSGDAPLILPPRPLFHDKANDSILPDRTGDTSCTPLDAHLIGSRDACVIMNAAGSSRMTSQDIPLTRFTGDPGAIEGMQLYIISRGRVWRLTDAALPGEILFSSGIIRIERHCGSLRARLTILTDPAAGRILHHLDVTNLSTADCRCDVADVLLPDLHAEPGTLEATRPDANRLVLRDRAAVRTLTHQLTLSDRPAQITVCTDATAFLGRGRTLADPASLEEPMADLPAASGADCLSFRVQLKLGGRAQTHLLFTTSLTSDQPVQWQELNSLTSLASLHARAVAEAIPIAPAELLSASRMTGALFWPGQPHQGAHAPIDSSLAAPMLNAPDPLLTVTIPDEAAIPRLRECLAASAWFAMHGQPITLYILCTAQTQPLAEDAVNTCLQPEDGAAIRILTDASPLMQEALFSVSRLVIHGDGRSITAQLNALRQPIPQYPRHPAIPAPAQLPGMKLLNPGGYGGFDPETGDPIICLEAYQTTPIPWRIRMQGDSFAFTADETGLQSPFGERLLLTLDGSVPFDPLRSGLPMIVRSGCGRIRWRVYAEDFTLTLDACCLCGRRAGLRSVRVRSHRKAPMTLHLTVTAGLAPSPIQHLSAVSDTVFSVGGEPGFLAAAEGAWSADVADTISLPVRHEGSRAARLSISLDVPAGLSAAVSWLCGYAPVADDAAAAQESVRHAGVSACFRAALEAAASRLPGLSISSPEPTLDLLVNHVLPRQALSADLPITIAFLTDQKRARNRLLRSLRNCPPGSLRPALLMALHLRLTGDGSILYESIGESDSLLDLLSATLLTYRLDRNAADMPREQLCEALLAAAAIRELLPFTDDETLGEHRRSLLNAADTYLWHTDHYGMQDRLLLDVQACAALAFGDTPRVRKGLKTCWNTLYDEENGLIRQQLPDDDLPCPGMPENGGQNTIISLLYLAALASLREADLAWELLRALNPLHHTDDPVRSEAYASAPWLLSAGMQASPAFAGHAAGEDAEAADLLLTIIMTQLLGLTIRGGELEVQPCVPSDWENFSVTLQFGTATWRIDMERGVPAPLLDGTEAPSGAVRLSDDGRIHQLRLPI